jgi:hypothetical protein
MAVLREQLKRMEQEINSMKVGGQIWIKIGRVGFYCNMTHNLRAHTI